MDGERDELSDLISDIQEVRHWSMPTPGTLFGVSEISTPDVVIWADSHQAANAVREAGYPQVVALIPARGRDLYAPLRDNADLLAKVGKVIIAGGKREFVEELARRVGRHRAWQVRWPDDCAGACDTMQSKGIQAVQAAIEAAEPYPIEGIHRPTAAAMLRHRHAPAPPVLTTGCDSTDAIMKLPGEGKLIVVTGIPNHGKSTWVLHVMAHTAQAHDRRWAIFTPEFGEWQNPAAQIMQWRAGKPFRPMPGLPGMSDREIEDGAAWCASRFSFLSCDGEADAPTLEWLLDLARACVLRDGTTDFVIDPFNEIEQDEDGRTETANIGRVLQRLRAFATRHGCNVWIVAHPTKLKSLKPGEPPPVPTSYDINGGANWANKADMIVVVHCPENVTQIHLLKARFRRWGRRGDVAKLLFDPTSGRFRSTLISSGLRDPEPPSDRQLG